ncbi:MAG: class I SAM-dependent methyltransferase [Planctomycetales bacterium]|nr:class I SAM-dependent methyltransferase [Planctomycetales bacterium]
MMSLTRLAERGLLPDFVVRMGIRRLLRARLDHERASQPAAADVAASVFADLMRALPIATEVDSANRQHYEFPADFFEQVLGPRRKYSCGLWERSDATLADAEQAMLELTCERAGIEDGMRLLDLGCGWGAFTLYAAERFPNCQIDAVSNSRVQKAVIERETRRRGWNHVNVVTANVADFQPRRTFDRIVSVEMFEHMRNHERLLNRIATWLDPEGRLFVHLFVHDVYPYLFEAASDDDWMAREFFSGGLMPSRRLLHEFDASLAVEKEWQVSGAHYQRTSEAWLSRLDSRRPALQKQLTEEGVADASHALNKWRIFFMACAELFGWDEGRQWYVMHYLLAPVSTSRGGQGKKALVFET